MQYDQGLDRGGECGVVFLCCDHRMSEARAIFDHVQALCCGVKEDSHTSRVEAKPISIAIVCE